MKNPTVCAVMLVNGRPEMVKRAVKCFREQTYSGKKWLMVVDSGDPDRQADLGCSPELMHVAIDNLGSIGILRNYANGIRNHWHGAADVICHWDSDDWSHSRRIEEQVALLLASGKECVGYRDMLFWCDGKLTRANYDSAIELGRRVKDYPEGYDPDAGTVWLYRNGDSKYCLGTSLCYWRSAWEARPFEDLPKCPTGASEDTQWLRGVNSWGVTSIQYVVDLPTISIKELPEPRMIAAVHAGNTSSLSYLGIKHGTAPEWQRASEWGSYCRERMAL